MNLQTLSDRMTYLLKDEIVEWVRQDDPMHITIKFIDGPKVSFGIPGARAGEFELDCSICETDRTSARWIAKADASNV